jgi:hypothetical protein
MPVPFRRVVATLSTRSRFRLFFAACKKWFHRPREMFRRAADDEVVMRRISVVAARQQKIRAGVQRRIPDFRFDFESFSNKRRLTPQNMPSTMAHTNANAAYAAMMLSFPAKFMGGSLDSTSCVSCSPCAFATDEGPQNDLRPKRVAAIPPDKKRRRSDFVPGQKTW